MSRNHKTLLFSTAKLEKKNGRKEKKRNLEGGDARGVVVVGCEAARVHDGPVVVEPRDARDRVAQDFGHEIDGLALAHLQVLEGHDDLGRTQRPLLVVMRHVDRVRNRLEVDRSRGQRWVITRSFKEENDYGLDMMKSEINPYYSAPSKNKIFRNFFVNS